VSEDVDWTLYHGSGDAKDRELIIGFTGLEGNLFQSSPIVLQHLDATEHDLLIIRDEDRQTYGSKGAGGVGLDALLQRLSELSSSYRSTVTIGASMGGAAAVRTAAALGARRGISIGGRGRDDAGVEAEAGAGTAPHGAGTELWCIYGAEHHRDPEGARLLQREFPHARLVPIAGVDTHNTPQFLLRQGALSSFYALLLGDGTGLGSIEGEVAPIRLAPRHGPPPWALQEDADKARRSAPPSRSRLRRVRGKAAGLLRWLLGSERRATPPPARPVRRRRG